MDAVIVNQIEGLIHCLYENDGRRIICKQNHNCSSYEYNVHNDQFRYKFTLEMHKDTQTNYVHNTIA